MKRFNVLLCVLIASCSDTKPEFIRWHSYLIPTAYILGEVGGSRAYSIGSESRDDIAVELRSGAFDGKYLQYTLTPATNFMNEDAKKAAHKLVIDGGIMEQHSSGFYKLGKANQSIHWQLVLPKYNDKVLVDVEPVATCSQLKSSPASCTFGFVDDGVYYTFSLSGHNISKHQEARDLLVTKLSEWKVQSLEQ